MRDFEHKRLSTAALILEYYPGHDTSHIIYKPSLITGACNFRVQSTHDGLIQFTEELFRYVLDKIVFSKKPCIVGKLKYMTVFGSTRYKYSGQRERIILPVNFI